METVFQEVTNTYVFGFKSYYVVWKPHNGARPNWNDRGLNRTMQYGNNPFHQRMPS